MAARIRIVVALLFLLLSGAAGAQTTTTGLPAATGSAPADLVQITQGGVTKRAPLSVAIGGVAPLLSNNLADLPNPAAAALNLGIPACVLSSACLGGGSGGGAIVATGSTTPRTAAARAGDVFNALDYGADPTGAADLGPALRAIAAKLGSNAASSTVLIPAGHYTLSSPVVFSGGAPILQGQGFVAGPNVNGGTWITVTGTGFTPFTFSGALARGAVVRDIAITEPQPSQVAGWAPLNYDYVFRIQDAVGEVTFDNVEFAGVTRGIYADNSGRLLIKNVVGQFYTAGIEIDDCYDIPRIEYLHAWTYNNSNTYVLAWQEANLDTVILRRVDGIFIGDLFTFAARTALYLTAGANGVTTKLYANSIYSDQSKYGVLVDGNGVNGQFGKVTTQANDVAAGGGAIIAGSRGMLLSGTNGQFQVDQWRSNSTNGPAIDLEGSGNRVSVNDLWDNTYYMAAPGDGTPAVMVADTSVGSLPANFAQVVGTPLLQGVAPLVLFNAVTNGGRTRTLQMNSVNGGSPGNEVRAYDNTAGNPVSLAAIGSDAKVDLQLQAKSSAGSVKLQAAGQTVVRIDDANGGTDDVLFRSGAGTMNLVAEGGDASIGYILTPKGPAGGVALQANGLTTVRTDNPNSGDSDLLLRPGTATLNLITESGSASADLYLAAKGPNGGIRLQAQGATVVRLDNPGAPGTSDLLIRTGTGTMALTVEDPAANANLVLNPKGLGTVALGTSPAASDNSTNVVTSAWVVGQHYLTAAPVASVDGRTGAVTLASGDVAGDAPLASPVFSGTPSVPTAAAGTSTTQAASTAFVSGAVASATAGVSSVNTRTGAVTLALSDIPGAFAAASAGPLATQAGATPSAAALAALGFTPYNATNPSSYVNAAGAAAAAPVQSVAGLAGAPTVAQVATALGGTTATTLALGNDARITGAAPLASPALTGTPAAPTAIAGTSTTQLATTAFDAAAVAGEAAIARTAEAAKAPLASPTFTGTVTAPILAVTGSQPISTVLAGPAGTAGAPTWRQLGVADVTGAAPLASPTLTGTPTFAPFLLSSSSGPLISFYGTLGGTGNYGMGTNAGEVTTYSGGAVGFRNSNSGGNAGTLFLLANPTGTTIPGLLTASSQSTLGTPPGGSGFARAGVYVLEASTAAATLARMTTNGAAAGTTNCVNPPNNSAYSMAIDITGIDVTTAGNAARYRLLDVMLLRGASASTAAMANGVSAAAANGSIGTGSTAAFTAAADTTNGCLALSVTPPNADTWHWSARVVTTEVQ